MSDPNSNITTEFKETPRPTEAIRDVTKGNAEETDRVRTSVRRGTNAKMPSLSKPRLKGRQR